MRHFIASGKLENDILARAMWSFYLIKNKQYTYAGISMYTSRRLRQHNGIIKGGAKYTLSKGHGWTYVCVVEGFPSKRCAMQFEWANKNPVVFGLENRIHKLYDVLNRPKWTSNSPDSNSIPLVIQWHGIDYTQYIHCCPRQVEQKMSDHKNAF